MISDSERRDVARRLRDTVRHLIDMGELAEILGFHRYSWSAGMLADRIADLIEPSEPKVRCVAEVKVDGERLEKLVHDAAVELTGIDREALLEIIEDLNICLEHAGPDIEREYVQLVRDRLLKACRGVLKR